jgi:hypothetical protein
MFKRLAVSAMILAGSFAVFTPSVAQASEYRHDERRVERREWRGHERWERRYDRPYFYDRFGRRICR